MTESMLSAVVCALELTPEEARTNCKELPQLHAFYFWSSRRGGKAMIIREDGARLIATSAVRLEDHMQAFAAGKRN